MAFAKWLSQARLGEEFCYHSGMLSWDRTRDARVDDMAQAAWDAAMDGRVLLFQRRLQPHTFLYIAKRTRRPI